MGMTASKFIAHPKENAADDEGRQNKRQKGSEESVE
jgi:hypothetical protein